MEIDTSGGRSQRFYKSLEMTTKYIKSMTGKDYQRHLLELAIADLIHAAEIDAFLYGAKTAGEIE